jgi:uroporphyrinogen-III decarboxylase
MIRVAKGPIQEILYQMTGLERFAIDYHERRECIDSLYEVMVQRYDEMYELAAEAPAEILQSADNITSDVVGVERFQRYCVSCYERHQRSIAGSGKRLAVHLDGRLRSLKDAIAAAPFEIVEAFTPAPVGDVTVAEARAAWPDKALWLNFTSSMHLQPEETIAAHTRQLIEEAGTKRGFGIGITEDIPAEHCARSLRAIARAIQQAG